MAAFAVTEQQTGGTNCFHPRTELRPAAHGDYVLDGGKWHITNAPKARLFLVWTRDAVTDSLVAVVVDRRWSGVGVGAPLAPAGACSSPVGSVTFQQVSIPHTHVIRFRPSGETVLREILTCERVLVAFPCLALMEVMLEKCMQFATRRKVADVTIASHQYVQRRLTDMEARLYSVRSMAQKTLDQLVAGAAVSKEASIVKMAAANLGMKCAEDAMKVCATYGLQEQAQFHMMYMDLLAATIGGGTEEAHRTVIFKEMLRCRRGSGRPLWI
jgi:isovaleryl-CoA dehydrogenase